MPCYFCDGNADGDIEHVPAEVLFPAILRDPCSHAVAGPDYKIATADDLKDAIALPGSRSARDSIITVPSCEEHNRGLSECDEALAVNALQVPHVHNAGWQMKRWYAAQIKDDLKLPMEKRTKAQRIGMRLLGRDAPEVRAAFDEDLRASLPPPPPMSDERVAEIKAHHKKEGDLVVCAVRKIAAGIYYAVTGRALGRKRVEKLSVVCPDFKPWSEYSARSDDDYFKEHFAAPQPATDWRMVVSGSPQVFFAQLLWHKKWGHHFALRFTIYGVVRLWVTGDAA